MCLQRFVTQNCGCYFTRFSNIYGVRPCLNLTEWNCISAQQQALIGANIHECELECPLECDTIKYASDLSILEYPSREVYDLISANATFLSQAQTSLQTNFSTYELFRDNTLALTIFYPLTEYTEITVSPKILAMDLLSQIGGSLGMFLGFSLFHILEVFEAVFLLIYILCLQKH